MTRLPAAQRFADDRNAIPRHTRRYSNRKLKTGWSPEIISNRLKRDHLYSKKKMRLSPEAIYQWIFRDAVYTHLIRRYKKRKKQRRYSSLRGRIPDRIDMAVVDKRVRYG